MRQTDETIAQEVYDSLWGQVGEEYRLPWVEDAAAAGSPCMDLYSRAIESAWKVSERLGAEEDPQVDQIIHDLLELQRMLCLKMFAYGRVWERSREAGPCNGYTVK